MWPSREFALNFVSGVPWFWRWVTGIPPLQRWFNRRFINIITNSTPPRPHALSLWGPANDGKIADYTSWTGLNDRTFTGRHLPPCLPDPKPLPPLKEMQSLFMRDAMITCPKSSTLFCFFAQWFTDSFLRTDFDDPRKNTSNHEIDLCQIYGLSPSDTALLRANQDGKLKSQFINGQEFPPYLFEPDGLRVRDEFATLSYINPGSGDFRRPIDDPFNVPERKRKLFVSGLERGNSTVFYSAINTIFLREHNRLCREMKRAHPAWNDDRLFETARNTNIALLLKIIIEDYINHLSTSQLEFTVEIGFAESQNWYRTNRICAEFDLLYRWHPLVPTKLMVGGNGIPDDKFRYNNDYLIDVGIPGILDAAVNQRAGRIGLKNTAPFLVGADIAALDKSRKWNIRSYNEYRQCFGLAPVRSFEELTGDQALAKTLRGLYQDVDRVELMVGLFAEQHQAGAVLGPLMTLMVGVDAFSQALTNPLLSKNVFGPNCFSEIGLHTIENTNAFDDIASRNSAAGARKASYSFKTPTEIPGTYGLPFIGKAAGLLDFFIVSGWEKFFLRRQRKYQSSVFKINLFQPTIAVLDHRAIWALFNSDDLVQDYGFSWAIPPLSLVGHVAPSVFGHGPSHDGPKALYLNLLRERGRHLQDVFQRTMDEFTERWVAAKQFNFSDEIEEFTVSLIFEWILGARPDPKDVRLIYNNIFLHFASAITKHIPWSTYSRSLEAYERLLDFVKKAPGFPRVAELSRASTEPGSVMDDDVLAKQLLFLLGMNSFLGTQCLLKSIVGELSRTPELAETLRGEISANLGSNAQRASIRELETLSNLDRSLREILRLHPPVFFIFGRATSDRTLESRSGTFAVRKGDLLMGVIPIAQRDPKIFTAPDEFDQERFTEQTSSEHLIWPRGQHDGEVTARDRTCPGKDVAILIAKLFSVALLTKVSWKLKSTPAWDCRNFSLNVAAPKGLMTVARIERIQT